MVGGRRIGTLLVVSPMRSAFYSRNTTKFSLAQREPVLTTDNIAWSRKLPFFGVHLACFAAFWTGVCWKAAALCFALYVVRMFGITAGYHRYFAHRSYRTSRFFQFVLALIGSCALQKGVLWWAAHHRHHHQHSDQEEDVHSPERRGFWWSHAGWFLCTRYEETEFQLIKDFAGYPELRWLNRHARIPGILLAIGCFLILGWQGLVWGFFISTVLLYHGTFAINSLCHIFGTVRYNTGDASRNSLILALITLGEGWHNNHHHYSTSTRMGFFWWEIDLTYYALKLLSFFGIVWELKDPPARVLQSPGLATSSSRLSS
jgi:stearoyl-CoA desaturase (delta-9 desaturase)